MDKKIEKILVEYREKLSLYGEYCIVVCSLLESLLKIDGYKYQLSYRIKNVDSVREKIQRKNTESKVYKHLSDIEDILGIRVVFYTEADRKKFILKLSTELGEQVHFEEKIRVSGYRSTHAIIEFGGERVYLAEYIKFKGLKC
jgi:ppGpp synthetase/RelA/SpoT-type nucleotidyltranferase